jgi:hypothetical protein
MGKSIGTYEKLLSRTSEITGVKEGIADSILMMYFNKIREELNKGEVGKIRVQEIGTLVAKERTIDVLIERYNSLIDTHEIDEQKPNRHKYNRLQLFRTRIAELEKLKSWIVEENERLDESTKDSKESK